MVLLERDEDAHSLETHGGRLGSQYAGLFIQLERLESSTQLLQHLFELSAHVMEERRRGRTEPTQQTRVAFVGLIWDAFLK